ncbi:MAG: class I SAM-dependent methyltransferase [Pirellulales bacterium]
MAGLSSSKPMEDRWRSLLPVDKSWRERWSDFGIDYVAPHDLSKSSEYPENSFDVIYSHACLGHIPSPQLQLVAAEMHRILKTNGISCHVIDLVDDHANVDPSIGPLDFLKYDDETWQRIGNSKLHYQNRLRPRDYVQLFAPPGWNIKCQLNPDARVKVDRTGFAKQFQDLTDEELQSERFSLIATKSGD